MSSQVDQVYFHSALVLNLVFLIVFVDFAWFVRTLSIVQKLMRITCSSTEFYSLLTTFFICLSVAKDDTVSSFAAKKTRYELYNI